MLFSLFNTVNNFFTNKDDLNVYVGISVLLVPEVHGTSVEGYVGLISFGFEIGTYYIVCYPGRISNV